MGEDFAGGAEAGGGGDAMQAAHGGAEAAADVEVGGGVDGCGGGGGGLGGEDAADAGAGAAAVEELAVEAYARWVLRQSNIVWNVHTRDAFHAAHPGVGMRPGDGPLTPDQIDQRYEQICRESLARSPAMR